MKTADLSSSRAGLDLPVNRSVQSLVSQDLGVVRDVQLVRLAPDLEELLADDPVYMEAIVKENWARVADRVHQLIGQTLSVDPISVDELAWDGYFVVDTHTHEVVGSCAFKGAPTADGTVEVGYFTYPGFEGKGYATAMVRKLMDLASSCPAIQRIIAHTLPENNASTRVLEKVGMRFNGEIMDPDDGRVWLWQMRIRTAALSEPLLSAHQPVI